MNDTPLSPVSHHMLKWSRFNVMAALLVAAGVTGVSWSAMGSQAAAPRPALATAPQAPANLHSFTGGQDIALLWDVSVSSTSVKYYSVYRNGKLLARATPANNSTYLTANGTRYYDAGVRPGVTYKYQVSATNAAGATSALSQSLSVTQPASSPATPAITVDTSAASDLAATMASAKSTLTTWYPKMVLALAWPDYTPPSAFTLKVDSNYGGVAYTSGTTITVSANYLRANPSDMGMFVHEAGHILQQYSAYTPNFIVEGIPDWVRENMYNDRNPVMPDANAVFNDGYGTSAYFLQWIRSTYNAPALVRTLNITAHAGGPYAPVLANFTAKTAGQLWTLLSGHGTSSLGPVAGVAGRCLDLAYYNTTNGNAVQLLDCAKNGAQDWLSVAEPSSTATAAVSLRVLGKCLDVQYSGTTAGTPAWIWDCNHSSAQQWVAAPGGALMNVNSGMCLQTKSGATTNGTPLEIAPCNGSVAQKWSLPPV